MILAKPICKFSRSFSRSLCLKTANRNESYDVVIVGGGIVGAATARELITRNPEQTYALLEKEQQLGVHQSGHNSGVLHSGIYYKPGTMKAKLCVEGQLLAYRYCDQHNIPYRKCGKLIVAVERRELPRLSALLEQGKQNGVQNLEVVDAKKIKQIEPNCTGLRAIWCPDTGIVDWGQVTRSFGTDFEQKGGNICTGFEVKNFRTIQNGSADEKQNAFPVLITNGRRTICAKYVVTCGGLFSDKLAQMSGCNEQPSIIPFRGDYLLVRPEKCNLINGNIYPVPDPSLPFLGVHFTPRMDGSIWLGPNAVLAFKREGYKATDFEFDQLCSSLRNRGFQRLALKHWLYGAGEVYRGLSLAAQVKQLQRYVPSLQLGDVRRGPAGVRAQALDSKGNLVDDFVFDYDATNRFLHVRNAPSPGATSSLAIAKVVADKFQEMTQISK